MSSILLKIVEKKRQEVEQAKLLRPLRELQTDATEAPAPRNFLKSVQGYPQIRLIAEVKKASPSKGIIRLDFDPVAIAKAYESAGAAALSVLTDEHFFQGHLEYLREIRKQVSLPILRKDFIIDEYQIWEARAAGADAVLLIAECLTENKLKDLLKLTHELDMTALVEFHAAERLPAVLDAQPLLIGVNNRDLNTFEVDLGHVVRLRSKIPKELAVVGESGIATRNDAMYLQENKIDAMLVGESLMRSKDIASAVRNLLGKNLDNLDS
jgi:indole-3-glycerol phosphate synthase